LGSSFVGDFDLTYLSIRIGEKNDKIFLGSARDQEKEAAPADKNNSIIHQATLLILQPGIKKTPFEIFQKPSKFNESPDPQS
jgi:hypothetical protein